MSGWSLFVKPQYPVTEDFSVYALLGFGGLDLQGSLVSAEPSIPVVDVDNTTFQWGIGMSYQVMENISLFADYAWLANSIDDVNNVHQLSVDAFTIGVNYHF
jgi:opacity protein-like surface antigen